MGDDQLVRRVREGDRDAYRVLVDRYAPMVFGLVRRYCEDPAETEDLAQEVFIRAYEGLDGFRGDASFSSWLYRIAVNRCRDWAKSPMRDRESIEAMEESTGRSPASLAAGGPTPEEDLERTERARRLQWALGELAPDYAVPFLLKYEQDLSYREMARMLDATAGALKVRVHRARTRLRKLLEDRI